MVPVSVMAGRSPPEANGPSVVHVTAVVEEEQAQPLPEPVSPVTPVGIGSVTVMGPVAGSPPLLWTASFHENGEPATGVPTAVLVTVRSAALIVAVAVAGPP